MPRLRTPCLLLAVLALLCGQVFGLQRGYLCERDGIVVETMADHCHLQQGVAVEDCGRHAEDEHHHSEHSEDDTTKQHIPLKVDLTASQVPAALSVQHFVQWVGLCMELLQPPVISEIKRLTAEPPRPGERPPPAALIVAKSIVFLV